MHGFHVQSLNDYQLLYISHGVMQILLVIEIVGSFLLLMYHILNSLSACVMTHIIFRE